MKAYKGFNKDMTCREFQYEEGKTYTAERAKLCESGFHACEAPIDCFEYYTPESSVYHEVELSGVLDEKGDDSKICGTKIKIGARVDFAGIVKAQFDFVKNKTEQSNSATGDCSANSATGNRSANSATGDWSANSATGYGSANISVGRCCTNYGGPASVNVGWGPKNKCRGKVGSYLVLSEWGDWDGEKFPLKGAVMVCVDGDSIKEDAWYALKNGHVVETDDKNQE